MAGERILGVLKQLKESSDRIEACMVARKGLEGVVMFPESFKADIGSVWEPLSTTLNDLLYLIDRNTGYHLDKISLEMLGFGVVLYVLEFTDTALIVFLKQDKDYLKTLDGLSGSISMAREQIME